MKNEKLMKAMPWLLIFGGFYALTILPPVVAGGCMVVGITVLLNQVWPEKWGEMQER